MGKEFPLPPHPFSFLHEEPFVSYAKSGYVTLEGKKPFLSSHLSLPTLRRLKHPDFAPNKRFWFDSQRHQYCFKALPGGSNVQPSTLETLCTNLSWLVSAVSPVAFSPRPPLKTCSHYPNSKNRNHISTNYVVTYILKNISRKLRMPICLNPFNI